MTGVRRPSRTSRLSSWVWCSTSYRPPSCGYSFFRVLKQWSADRQVPRHPWTARWRRRSGAGHPRRWPFPAGGRAGRADRRHRDRRRGTHSAPPRTGRHRLGAAAALADDPNPLCTHARTPDQLRDNLAALDLLLDADVLARLDAVSTIPLGFPHDMLRRPRQLDAVTGGNATVMDFDRPCANPQSRAFKAATTAPTTAPTRRTGSASTPTHPGRWRSCTPSTTGSSCRPPAASAWPGSQSTGGGRRVAVDGWRSTASRSTMGPGPCVSCPGPS